MSWPTGRSADGGLDRVTLDAPGAIWLCGKRVVSPDPEAALTRANAQAIACFQEKHEVEREHPDYADWLRSNADDRAIWFPIPDLGAPPLADAVPIVEHLASRIEGGEGLVLHCAGGLGRAPTMATLVLVQLGWGPAEAAAHVAASRPMAGPEAGSQAEIVTDFAAMRQQSG